MRRTAGIVALVAVTTVVATPAHAAGKPPKEITATVETPALFDDAAGGVADADDPAIWINGSDRARSRVIGTAKNGGLRVYDLAGREVQAIATPAGGRFNHVDLVAGFPIGGRRTDLAVVTDRGLDQLRIYRIEASGHLTDITADDAPLLFSRDADEVAGQATGYGLATYGRYAVVSRRHTTRLGIFRLEERAGKVTYRVTDTLDLPKQFGRPDGSTWAPCLDEGEEPQVEGMVVDAEAGVLYAAQEDVAVWRIRLDGDQFAGAPRVVEYVAEFGVPHDTGCVPATTGVQHSDGAAAISVPLPGYPHGLLVLHDGENTPDGGRVGTDFKYVDWRALSLSTRGA